MGLPKWFGSVTVGYRCHCGEWQLETPMSSRSQKRTGRHVLRSPVQCFKGRRSGALLLGSSARVAARRPVCCVVNWNAW